MYVYVYVCVYEKRVGAGTTSNDVSFRNPAFLLSSFMDKTVKPSWTKNSRLIIVQRPLHKLIMKTRLCCSKALLRYLKHIYYLQPESNLIPCLVQPRNLIDVIIIAVEGGKLWLELQNATCPLLHSKGQARNKKTANAPDAYFSALILIIHILCGIITLVLT